MGRRDGDVVEVADEAFVQRAIDIPVDMHVLEDVYGLRGFLAGGGLPVGTDDGTSELAGHAVQPTQLC